MMYGVYMCNYLYILEFYIDTHTYVYIYIDIDIDIYIYIYIYTYICIYIYVFIYGLVGRGRAGTSRGTYCCILLPLIPVAIAAGVAAAAVLLPPPPPAAGASAAAAAAVLPRLLLSLPLRRISRPHRHRTRLRRNCLRARRSRACLFVWPRLNIIKGAPTPSSRHVVYELSVRNPYRPLIY